MDSKENQNNQNDFLSDFDDELIDLSEKSFVSDDEETSDDFDELDLLNDRFMSDEDEDDQDDHPIASPPQREVNEERASWFEDIAHQEPDHDDEPTEDTTYTPPVRRKPQSASNINELLASTKAEDEVLGDEDFESVQRQIRSNKRRAGGSKKLPEELYLLDEPDDSVFDDKIIHANAGDEKEMRALLYVTAGIFSLVIVVLALIFTMLISNSTDNAVAQSSQNGQTVASGIPIDELINSSSNGNSHDANKTNTPGNSNDSSSESSTSPSDSNDNNYSGNSQSNESSNKSSVIYEIKAEGDIRTASVSYINGIGSAEQDTGIVIPWKVSVDAEKSVTPHMAVASSGRGTLTCSILKDGNKVDENTSSGESPTVECRE